MMSVKVVLEHTLEEIDHLWKVLEAHMGAHQKVMQKIQTQVAAQVPVPVEPTVTNNTDITT